MESFLVALWSQWPAKRSAVHPNSIVQIQKSCELLKLGEFAAKNDKKRHSDTRNGILERYRKLQLFPAVVRFPTLPFWKSHGGRHFPNFQIRSFFLESAVHSISEPS